MPILETEVKSSWADEVEEGDFTELPPQSVTFENGIRKIVEYKRNDEGKKVKVERQYKVETKKVQKSVAKRRTVKKFGMSADDGPGPDPATTIAAEEVFMQFVTSKDYDEQQNDDTLSKIRQHGMVKCRLCRGDHWTSGCPYKDKLGEIPTGAAAAKPRDDKMPPGPEDKSKPAKYIPPSKRGDGAPKGGESMSFRGKDDRDCPTIRVTNLSETTRESDLQELFKNFGSIQRIYLGKDKVSGVSKGFAFINFFRKEDAAKAIKTLNGYGYDHLILSVEWSKPQNQ